MKYNITYEIVSEMRDKLDFSMKFNELCEALGIEPPKNSRCSKDNILKQLRQYCDIDEVKKPGSKPVYIIRAIYSEALIDTIHKNNKFQSYVEQAVLTKALETKGERLYMSNIEILYLASLVNSNFKIICNEQLAAKLKDRRWLHGEAYVIYSVLYDWLRERLKQMHSRHVIELQRGYRVYKTIRGYNGQEYTIKQDVPKGSPLEEQCQEIYAKAVEQTFGIPKDWKGGWLRPEVYTELKRNVIRLCREMFEGDWDNIRVVHVIIPVKNEQIILNRLKNVEEVLNEESRRKIKSTRRLNHLTGTEREIAISELIDIHTSVDYKSMLKELNNETGNVAEVERTV